MSSAELKLEIQRLAKSVFAARHLVNACSKPVRVAVMPSSVGAESRGQEAPNESLRELGVLIQQITNRLDLPELDICKFDQTLKFSSFELVLSRNLALERSLRIDASLNGIDQVTLENLVKNAIEPMFRNQTHTLQIKASDGALLNVYAKGDPSNPPVVLVSPCGMPIELSEHWFTALAENYFVMGWESRGLFSGADAFDSYSHDVLAQANDLYAVMDHFKVQCGHIMGLCGGAVIATVAASMQLERVASLSLWHGDFDCGSMCQKTRHQKDTQELLNMASKSRLDAEFMQSFFKKPQVLDSIRAEWAHLLLYPYANTELLYRYGRLNGSIMATDIRPFLAKIEKPTLVVVSKEDTTVHASGSHTVATTLPQGILHEEPNGDHLSLFLAPPKLAALANEFFTQAN